MHDHDFEKQVHQKMEELRLEPSGSVWEKVETRLYGKEKRRPWIFWLPLLVVFTGIGGYFFVGHHSGIPGEKNDSRVISGRKEESRGTAKQNRLSAKDTFHARPLPVDLPGKVPPPLQATTPVSLTSMQATTPASGRSAAFLSQNDNTVVPVNIQPGSFSYSAIPEEPVVDTSSLRTPLPAIPGLAEISSSINTSVIIPGEPRFIKPVEKKKQQRWEWGLHLQAGRSALNSGKLNRLFASADAVSNTNNFFSGNAVYRQPSPLKAGSGISSGIFARSILSGRFKLSAGLNYSRFTTSHVVGEKFDSSFASAPGPSIAPQLESSFYRRGESRKYINRYHYIEMPVLLETKLFKRSQLPVTWNAGFSVGRLLSGKQLNYDYNTGLYAEDDVHLNKTQFSLLTGLSMRFFNRHRIPLEIGPQVQYGLNNFMRKEIDGSKHLTFFSLQANFILGRK